MKLVLIQPPIEDFYITSQRGAPLGLYYLKRYIETYLPDWDVVLIDFCSGKGKKEIAFPESFSYLKDYYIQDESPFCSFSKYYRFGYNEKEIKKNLLLHKDADAVGISISFSAYSDIALKLASIVKKVIACPVILGGHHVSCLKERILENSNIDYIVLGEGERPLVELLVALEQKKDISQIKQIGFRKNSKIIVNEDFDYLDINSIPYPDLTSYEKLKIVPILTSRGCPYRCDFCVIRHTFPKYRRRNNDSILSELSMYYKHGFNEFNFEDDNLIFCKESSFELFSEISRKFKGISCHAMNGVSYFNLNAKLIAMMQKSGFRKLDISLVSINENSNKFLNRPYSLSLINEVIETCEKLDISFILYIILGLPFESVDDIIKSLSFCSRTRAKIGPSLYYYLPDKTLKNIDPIFYRSTAMLVGSTNFTREDLFTLFVVARIVNFLKGLRLEEDTNFYSVISGNISLQLNKRQDLGINILRKLMNEKMLYAYNKRNYIPITRFKYDLFIKYLSEVGFIKTMMGSTLDT